MVNPKSESCRRQSASATKSAQLKNIREERRRNLSEYDAGQDNVVRIEMIVREG